MKSSEHPIFLESIEYIRSQIGLTGLDRVQQSILERIIHASGDLNLQSFLRFSPNASSKAINSLRKGTQIVTDTYMAKAAIISIAKRTLNSDVKCILDMAPEYIDEITVSRQSDKAESLSDEEKDELYEMALKIVKTEKKASTSFLQRKLQIGYNRAARIIDQMEDNGVVSKANHVGKREVL